MNAVKKTKGFTIIEVLAVIAIMAILSTIIYASFSGIQAKSRDQKRVSDINLLKLSLEAYFNKNGQYPARLSDLTPTFIASIPTQPAGGPSTPAYGYNYTPLSNTASQSVCTTYQLWTTFEQTNQYLLSKKGLDSSNTQSLASLNLVYCNSPMPINAASNPLIYDVMPQ